MSSPSPSSSSPTFFFSFLDSSDVGIVVLEESNEEEAAGVPVTSSLLTMSSCFSPSPVLVGVISTWPSTSLLGAATTVCGSTRSNALRST